MDKVPETPEEIEAYVENSKQVERLMEFAYDPEIAVIAEEWLEKAIALMNKLSEYGMSHVEVAAAIGGMGTQAITEWAMGSYE
jgi:hypothetical protein